MPWSLTPLTSPVLGGGWLSGAALQWMVARAHSVQRTPLGLAATIAVTGLELLGALVNREAFDDPSASIAAFLAFVVALGLAAGGVLPAGRFRADVPERIHEHS